MTELILTLPTRPRGIALLAAEAPWPAAPKLKPASPTPEQLRQETEALELALSRVAQAVAHLQKQRASEVESLRVAAIELALAVAAKVLRGAADASQFPIEAVVRELTAELNSQGAITIYLHPDDLAWLRARFEGPAPLGESVRLLADASLPRGDARAEAGDDVVVSQLADQLADLRDEMLRSVKHGMD